MHCSRDSNCVWWIQTIRNHTHTAKPLIIQHAYIIHVSGGTMCTSIYTCNAQKPPWLFSYFSDEENKLHLPTEEAPRHIMDRGQCGFNKQSYSRDCGRKSTFLSSSCVLYLIAFRSQLHSMLFSYVLNFKNLLTSVASSLRSWAILERANSHITHTTDSWPEAFAPLLFTRFVRLKVDCGISLVTENKSTTFSSNQE